MKMKKLAINDKTLLINLNNTIFSIIYDETFYKHIFTRQDIHVFLFIEDAVIGTVSFIIKSNSAYIVTFGILPQFRRLGKGKKCWNLLEFILKHNFNCDQIDLHSHTANLIAKDFYLSNGFEINSLVFDYYIDIYPTSAYQMGKQI